MMRARIARSCSLDQCDDLGGAAIPVPAAQRVSQSFNRRATVRCNRPPAEQPRGQIGGIIGIGQEQVAKLFRIALRHARAGADNRRQAGAKRLLHVQTIGFISRRAHQKIAGGEHVGDIVAKAKEHD
jgi:hypothetical protein